MVARAPGKASQEARDASGGSVLGRRTVKDGSAQKAATPPALRSGDAVTPRSRASGDTEDAARSPHTPQAGSSMGESSLGTEGEGQKGLEQVWVNLTRTSSNQSTSSDEKKKGGRHSRKGQRKGKLGVDGGIAASGSGRRGHLRKSSFSTADQVDPDLIGDDVSVGGSGAHLMRKQLSGKSSRNSLGKLKSARPRLDPAKREQHQEYWQRRSKKNAQSKERELNRMLKEETAQDDALPLENMGQPIWQELDTTLQVLGMQQEIQDICVRSLSDNTSVKERVTDLLMQSSELLQPADLAQQQQSPSRTQEAEAEGTAGGEHATNEPFAFSLSSLSQGIMHVQSIINDGVDKMQSLVKGEDVPEPPPASVTPTETISALLPNLILPPLHPGHRSTRGSGSITLGLGMQPSSAPSEQAQPMMFVKNDSVPILMNLEVPASAALPPVTASNLTELELMLAKEPEAHPVCVDLAHLSALGDTLTVALPPSGQMPPLFNGTPAAAIGTYASFGTEGVMEMQVAPSVQIEFTKSQGQGSLEELIQGMDEAVGLETLRESVSSGSGPGGMLPMAVLASVAEHGAQIIATSSNGISPLAAALQAETVALESLQVGEGLEPPTPPLPPTTTPMPKPKGPLGNGLLERPHRSSLAQDREEWQQHLSKFLDGQGSSSAAERILQHCWEELAPLVQQTQSQAASLAIAVENLTTTIDMVNLLQVQLRLIGLLIVRVREVWSHFLMYRNLLASAHLWTPEQAPPPGEVGGRGAGVPITVRDAASGFSEMGTALTMMYDVCKEAAWHVLKMVLENYDGEEPDHVSHASTGTDVSRDEQEPDMLCGGYVVDQLVFEGLELHYLVNEWIDAFSMGNVVQGRAASGPSEASGIMVQRSGSGGLTLENGGAYRMERTRSVELNSTGDLHPTTAGQELKRRFSAETPMESAETPLRLRLDPPSSPLSPSVRLSPNNSRHWSSSHTSHPMLAATNSSSSLGESTFYPEFYTVDLHQICDELSAMLHELTNRVLEMALRVSELELELRVRSTILSNNNVKEQLFSPGSALATARLTSTPRGSMHSHEGRRRSMFHWAATLSKNITLRVLQAWWYDSSSLMGPLHCLVKNTAERIQNMVQLCKDSNCGKLRSESPAAFDFDDDLLHGQPECEYHSHASETMKVWKKEESLSTMRQIVKLAEVVLDLGRLSVNSPRDDQMDPDAKEERDKEMGQALLTMATELIQCLSSWRCNLKRMTHEELTTVQDIALPVLLYVRNLDQSNISKNLLDEDSFQDLKDKTADAVNVLIKAQRLSQELLELEAGRKREMEREMEEAAAHAAELRRALSSSTAAAGAAAAAQLAGPPMDTPPPLTIESAMEQSIPPELSEAPNAGAGTELGTSAERAHIFALLRQGEAEAGEVGEPAKVDGAGTLREAPSDSINRTGTASESAHMMCGDRFWDCEWPQMIKMIGSGSFGVTYVAKWHMAHVAMKVMKFDDGNEKEAFRAFYKEVDFHRMLHHPNVVRFLGASTRGPTRSPALLLELCDKALSDVIMAAARKKTRALDNWGRRLHYALDAARGMVYLHARGVMHNDLKSANLLIDRCNTVKVCDFGMSMILGRQKPENGFHSPGWCAPEVLRGDPYNELADVYSFGVVMWELATLQIPWDGINRMAIVYTVVDKEEHVFTNFAADPDGLQPMEDYVQLAERCLAYNPVNRPSFTEVAKALEALYKRVKRSEETH